MDLIQMAQVDIVLLDLEAQGRLGDAQQRRCVFLDTVLFPERSDDKHLFVIGEVIVETVALVELDLTGSSRSGKTATVSIAVIVVVGHRDKLAGYDLRFDFVLVPGQSVRRDGAPERD